MISKKDLFDYLEFDQEAQTRYLLNALNESRRIGKDDFIEARHNSYHQCLSCSFGYAETPEGFYYWAHVYNRLVMNEGKDIEHMYKL